MDHVAVLAVYRHEPLGPHEIEHELELFTRRVPRHVHVRLGAVHDIGTGPGQ